MSTRSAGFTVSNTLLITQLAPDAFTGHALESLRKKLDLLAQGKQAQQADAPDRATAKSACIHKFIPLPSFARVMVVLRRETDALRVKLAFDRASWCGQEIRVYFGEHTALEEKKKSLLGVPDNDRLWLISPPGSPPVDWESTREEPPNLRTHADDLFAALSAVAEQQERQQEMRSTLLPSPLEPPTMQLLNGGSGGGGRLQTLLPSSKVRLSREEVTLPAIAVQNWDDGCPSAMDNVVCGLAVPALHATMPAVDSTPSQASAPSMCPKQPAITFTFTTTTTTENEQAVSDLPSPATPDHAPIQFRTSIPPPL
ncbi:Calcipressin [Syncephalis pseudoplumigaleata]|uniref:Calcipressin n=1 Tax=Syncephalis pseudoplumigaleata TaxID=1712513 RepID=A0A4P9Z6J3_9FUNG|nr:Calcipressin [Syncephalis pseudoplumigaleata]|eukprot:RKP27782.1 Calcipressin [Syncephalis pseudoplumigaleata]